MIESNIYFVSEVPSLLSDKETEELFKQVKCGNMGAREKLINHNIRLVMRIVISKLNMCDKEELFSIGLIGLINAVDTYDLSKEVKFSTYAFKCIENEILMFLRKNKKNTNNVSLDELIFNTEDSGNFKLGDILEDKDSDFIKKFEEDEDRLVLKQIIDELSPQEKELIAITYGFDCKPMCQREIAQKLNISQPGVSKRLTRIYKKIKTKLTSRGLIETPREKVSPKVQSEIMVPTDDKKLLEFLRNLNIPEYMYELSNKECVIVLLRIGYINNKYYSVKDISRLLGISEIEVIESIRKILILYRNKINSYIESLNNDSDLLLEKNDILIDF